MFKQDRCVFILINKKKTILHLKRICLSFKQYLFLFLVKDNLSVSLYFK